MTGLEETTHKKQNIFGIIFLLLTTAILASYAGYWVATINKPVYSPKIEQSNSISPVNPLLTIQQESAIGKITKIQGDQIILEGDQGNSISLKLSPNLKIYNLPNVSASSSAKITGSQNVSDIVLNQKATVILVPENGVMSVVSIAYLPKSK